MCFSMENDPQPFAQLPVELRGHILGCTMNHILITIIIFASYFAND